MRITTRIMLAVVMAAVLPTILLGISGFLVMQTAADRALEQSADTLLHATRQRLCESAIDKADLLGRFLRTYRADVTMLASQAQLVMAHEGELCGPYLSNLYPDRDTAGLPACGYLHPQWGAFANWERRGYRGSIWVRRAVMDQVRSDPAQRQLVAQRCRQSMALVPAMMTMYEQYQTACELVWIVTTAGVACTYPNDYGARLQVNPGFNDLDENREEYVCGFGPASNPARLTRWMAPYVDAIKKVWMTSCVAPVYENDKFAGTMGIDLLCSVFTKLVQDLQFENGGYAFLISGEGLPLALTEPAIADLSWEPLQRQALAKMHRDEGTGWTPEMLAALAVPLTHHPTPALGTMIGHMTEQATGSAVVRLGGEEKIVAYAPIGEAGWSLGLVLPVRQAASVIRSAQETITNGFRHSALTFALLVVLVALVAGVVGTFLGWRSSAPLNRMIADIDRLGRAGEWREVATDAGGELETLARSVNGMVRALVEKEEQLAQSRRIEAIGLLAGGVAHDFNNLLTPIMGYCELLLQGTSLSDRDRINVGEMVVSCERARSLVQQLMAFGRKQVLELRALDLNLVVAGFGRLLRRTLRENIAMSFDVAPGLPRVLGDRNQIEQILMNLAMNAQDAMPDGGTLSLRASAVKVAAGDRAQMVPGDYVRLVVADTGVGLAPEVRAHVFEPFFTTKAMGHGAGLGLATVYGIVKQHRGHIEVESQPGRGATFFVWLPAATATAIRDDSRAGEKVAVIPRGCETILLAEDEATVRQLAETMLTNLGYNVLTSGTPQGVLDVLAQHPGPIDLLLTDVIMPTMSGRELYEKIVALRPGIRVLYMSGYTAEIIAKSGRLEPGTGFLQKPFTVEELAERLRATLDRS